MDPPPPPPDPVPGPPLSSKRRRIHRFIEGLHVPEGIDIDAVAALPKAIREKAVRDQFRLLVNPVTGQEESVLDSTSDEEIEANPAMGPREGNTSKSPYIILYRGDMEEGETLEEYAERKRNVDSTDSEESEYDSAWRVGETNEALDMGSDEENMSTPDNPVQGPANSTIQSGAESTKDEVEEAIKKFLSVSYTASPIPPPDYDGDADDDDAQPIKRFENLWRTGTPPPPPLTPAPKVIPPWAPPPVNTNEAHIFQTIIRKTLDADRQTKGLEWDESRDGPLEKWEEHTGYQKMIRNRRSATSKNPYGDTLDRNFKLRIPPVKEDATNKKKGGQGGKTPVHVMRVPIRNDFKEQPFRIYFYSKNWNDTKAPVDLCVAQPGVAAKWIKCRHPNCVQFNSFTIEFCKIHNALRYAGTAVILYQAQTEEDQQSTVMAFATFTGVFRKSLVSLSWFTGHTFIRFLSQLGLSLQEFKTLGLWNEIIQKTGGSKIRDSFKLGFCLITVLNNIKKGGPEGIILPHDSLQFNCPDREIVVKFLADNGIILSVGNKSRYGSTAQPPYAIQDQIPCPSGYNGFGYPGQKYIGKNATIKQVMAADKISVSHNKRTSIQKANCTEDSENAGFKIYQPQLSKKDERVLVGIQTEVVLTQEQEELWMKLRYDVEMAESVGQCADWICWLLEETIDGYPIQCLNKKIELGFSHPKTQFPNILSTKFIPFQYGPKHQDMLKTFIAYNTGKDFTFQFPEEWDPSTMNFSTINNLLEN